MAKDYPVKERSEYVRGVLTDSILRVNTFSFFCHMCGESEKVRRDGCHTYCFSCGATSEGCGD